MNAKWKERPTINNKIPKNDNMILFVDESGCGNKEMLKKAYEDKHAKVPYKSRNCIYILNGVVISGRTQYILQNRFNDLKKKITPNGVFDYDKKGIRPIVFRNHDMNSKNPPFNNLDENIINQLNKILNITDYTQIAAGLNFYSYTQFNLIYNGKSSPLLMSLGILLIKYAEYLNKNNKKGIIIFEEETRKHDTLKLNYIKNILKNGNKTYGSYFFKSIKAVYFRKKWTEENKKDFKTTAGLELADLTISPLRNILNPEFQIIARKLYNYPNYVDSGFTAIN